MESRSHLPEKRASDLNAMMKGAAVALGEREEDLAFLQPRKTWLLKTADEIRAGYDFSGGLCSPLALLLGCRPLQGEADQL